MTQHVQGQASLVFGPLERERGLITPGLLIPADERDLEDLLLDFEEDLKALHSVQCSPSPGEPEARTVLAAIPTIDSEAGSNVATLQSQICATSAPPQCPSPRIGFGLYS